MFFTFLSLSCEQQPTEQKTAKTLPTSETLAKKEDKFSYDGLSAEEKANFDKLFPPKIREFLENAETIDFLATLPNLVTKKKLSLAQNFTPNQMAKISNPALKKQFLNGFLADIKDGKDSSESWNPQHGLRVSGKNQNVTIFLCYSCGKFRITGSFGDFNGKISGSGSNVSEKIINDFIDKYAQEVE